MKQKIVIVGQGAMGLLCYHHLQQAKNKVSLLSSALSANLSSITPAEQSNSIPSLAPVTYSYTAHRDTTTKSYPLVYAQADTISQADIIIVCVKSYQVAAAVKPITNMIKSTCLIVLAHNGMGTLAKAANLLPVGQRIIAMLTTHGCLRHSSLKITHTGLGHSDIGLLSGEMTQSEMSDLAQLLNQAMPTFSFEKNIRNKQWLKLAINCVINPITALNDIENGQVNLVKYTELKTQLIAEIVEVAKMEGINFTNKEITKVVQDVAQATATNSSSMRCDVLAKRQTEINYINGYVHRLGIKHNIATPMNTHVWQAVVKIQAQF